MQSGTSFAPARPSLPTNANSVGDEIEVDPTEPLGVGEDVDRDDPAPGDGERDDGERASVGRPRDATRDAVDARARGRGGELTERVRLRGDGFAAADAGDEGGPGLAAVRAEHDIRVEHGEQSLEVARTSGGEERVDD